MQTESVVSNKLAALAIATAFALCGCGFVKSAQQGFHSSFRQSFQKSFLDACEQHPGFKNYCVCTYDEISKKYSDEQLMKMTTDQDSMKSAMGQVARDCASKLPKG
jgi:hypothetical protein